MKNRPWSVFWFLVLVGATMWYRSQVGTLHERISNCQVLLYGASSEISSVNTDILGVKEGLYPYTAMVTVDDPKVGLGDNDCFKGNEAVDDARKNGGRGLENMPIENQL